MRKILLLFICAMTFCVSEKAFALDESKQFYGAETIDGMYYRKELDGNTGYGVMGIKRRVSDNIAVYCLEPFEVLSENQVYQKTQIIKGTMQYKNFDSATLKLVQRIAFYGYGYRVNTDDYWYGVTQMLIWKVLYPTGNFQWTDTPNGLKTEKYDEKERQLLEVAKHSLAFEDETVEFPIDDNIKIGNIKSNLFRFTIYANANLKLSLKDNMLEIAEPKSGTYKITLKRYNEILLSSMALYTDDVKQDLLLGGNLNDDSLKITIKIYAGTITINKDAVSDSLVGAEYGLYKDKELVQNITFQDSDSYAIEELKMGTYCLKMLKAPVGHYFNSEESCVTISKEQLNENIEVSSKLVKVKIAINKLYGTLDNQMPEENVEFNIYNANGEKISTLYTDNDGNVETTLFSGKYEIIQKTNNYTPSVERIPVSINENTPLLVNYKLSDYKVELPNAGMDFPASYVTSNILVILFVGLRKFVKTFKI